MRTSALLSLAAVMIASWTLLGSGAQGAATSRAKVTVSITAEGTALSGTVSSAKPAKCAANRLVQVFEQVGSRGGGDDVRRFSVRTSLSNGKHVWSGEAGGEGSFYAKLPRKKGCKAGASPSIAVCDSGRAAARVCFKTLARQARSSH